MPAPRSMFPGPGVISASQPPVRQKRSFLAVMLGASCALVIAGVVLATSLGHGVSQVGFLNRGWTCGAMRSKVNVMPCAAPRTKMCCKPSEDTENSFRFNDCKEKNTSASWSCAEHSPSGDWGTYCCDRAGATSKAHVQGAAVKQKPGVLIPQGAEPLDIDGRRFQAALHLPGASPQLLVGGGSRYKYGFVKVYALGLYLPQQAILEDPLQAFVGTTSADQLGDDFFTAVTELPRKKPATLVLQFHRAVDVDSLATAIKEGLAPRLDEAVLDKFHDMLQSVLKSTGVPEGLELTFACNPKGIESFAASGDGANRTDLAELKEPAVCPALFDLYYGAEPISQSIKTGMAEGYVRLISSLSSLAFSVV